VIKLTSDKEAIVIPVWVQPGAGRDRIVGEHGGRLKIAVSAPPEGGRANKAVIRFLAKALDTKKSSVEIRSGEKSREKQVAVVGVPLSRVKQLCESSAG